MEDSINTLLDDVNKSLLSSLEVQKEYTQVIALLNKCVNEDPDMPVVELVRKVVELLNRNKECRN